jgi:glutathione S-transferase
MLRLITIPISHYCEKARWALERARIPYREERHVQGVHQFAARRAGGGKTVPVLVTPERVLSDSADILTWVDERTPPEYRLFPAQAAERREVEGLCRRLDTELGPRGRRLMYVHMFTAPKLALDFNNAGVPRWEDRAIRLGWPVAKAVVGRVLEISPGVEREDEAAVWRELDFIAQLRADGRPHLCGESFSAADLTFAALAAPMIVPPAYGVPLPQPDVMPSAMATVVRRAREHPAGAYALELFAQHRQRFAV